jgi:hypothetical protein
MCTDFLPRHLEDGCYKPCGVETPVGVSIADHTYHMLSRHLDSCKEEVDFHLYPNPAIMFQVQGPQEAYPKTTLFSSSTTYAEAPQYAMESPELRAPSNYSFPSGASAGSSALNSPFSIPTPQYSMWTPELRTSSNYSTLSGLSAVSASSIGSPHSIHGHIVPGPEFGLGSTPRIASYDNFGPYNEYTFSCGGMDDFTLDFNPSKLNANGFVGKYKTVTKSVPHSPTSLSSE